MNRLISPQEAELLGRVLFQLRSDGQLDKDTFEDLHRRFLFHDDEGGTWTVGLKTGKWHRKEQGSWAAGSPPASLQIESEVVETIWSKEKEAPKTEKITPRPAAKENHISGVELLARVESAIEVTRPGGKSGVVLASTVLRGSVRAGETVEVVADEQVLSVMPVAELLNNGAPSISAGDESVAYVCLEDITLEDLQVGLNLVDPERFILRTPGSVAETSSTVIPITVPDSIGESGVLTRWFFADGQTVEQGEAVVAIESDKASLELEAPASGVLKILFPENSTVSSGDVTGQIR